MVGSPTSSAWSRPQRTATLAMVCATAVLLTSCSLGSAASRSGASKTSAAIPTSVDPGHGTLVSPVAADSRTTAAVGGTTGHPLVVQVEPGDFAGEGAVHAQPSSREGPTVLGFTATGSAREVSVDGELRHPLTMSFTAGKGHSRDLPIIWHYDAKSGWAPVAVGDPGATATAQRSQFSPYLVGLQSIPAYLRDAATAFTEATGIRTSAPSCHGKAPSWATLVAPTLDVVRTCATTNTLQGVQRAEVRLKNNRGLVQELTVPDGVAYAAVEGQPESVRRLVRTEAGGRDVILLPPGKVVSIGFTRPQSDLDITLLPEVSNLALAVSVLNQLGNLTGDSPDSGLVTELVTLADITAVVPEVAVGHRVMNQDEVRNLVVKIIRTVGESMSDKSLAKAVALAQKVVAAETGRALAVVRSDEMFNDRVGVRAMQLYRLGKIFKALKVLEVSKLVIVVWEAVAEMVSRAMTKVDPAIVTFHLQGSPRPLDPSCRKDDVSSALCAFVTAVQSGKTSKLTHRERQVAMTIKDLPRSHFTVTSCQLEGDVTVRCEITFTKSSNNSEPTSASFYVQPANGNYQDGQIILPPGEKLQYQVIQYLGLGVTANSGATSSSFAPFTLNWQAHTSMLKVTSSGLATESVGNGCCDPLIDMTYQLSNPRVQSMVARATARLVSVHVYAGWSSPSAKAPPKVGDIGTVTVRGGLFTEPFNGFVFCDSRQAQAGKCGA